MGTHNPPADKKRFRDLVELMARLRSPSGCPWDREQDHRSLRPCLLEETYEVLDAIDRDDPEELRQELGDLLLQVVFHAQLAAEAGRFDMGDVIQGLYDKLVSRHPHVFGEASAATPDEVLHQWDRLKQKERDEDTADSLLEVPASLPALSRAQVVQRRAARLGRTRTGEEAGAAAAAAVSRLSAGAPDRTVAEAAIGELLLAAVDLARLAGVDAEQALRERINHLTEQVRSRSRDPDASAGARAGPK
jgi:tetrapyrrole methylase family protein/MazG family protein